MDIVLSREDYIALRPNKLKNQFIDDVRKFLSETETPEDMLKKIQSAFKQLNENLEKQSGDEFLL
jgi:hypothetical protein